MVNDSVEAERIHTLSEADVSGTVVLRNIVAAAIPEFASAAHRLTQQW